jgi:hypothetical protein
MLMVWVAKMTIESPQVGVPHDQVPFSQSPLLTEVHKAARDSTLINKQNKTLKKITDLFETKINFNPIFHTLNQQHMHLGRLLCQKMWRLSKAEVCCVR